MRHIPDRPAIVRICQARLASAGEFHRTRDLGDHPYCNTLWHTDGDVAAVEDERDISVRKHSLTRGSDRAGNPHTRIGHSADQWLELIKLTSIQGVNTIHGRQR